MWVGLEKWFLLWEGLKQGTGIGNNKSFQERCLKTQNGLTCDYVTDGIFNIIVNVLGFYLIVLDFRFCLCFA